MNNEDMVCPFCGNIYQRKCTFSLHIKRCKLNPDRVDWKSHPHSKETKKKLSEKMKRAHEEGRAWNIGKSRWNNSPSYPEKWFMKVIENYFNDKDYIREFSFSKFSLDFAWVHKRCCIEIDGEQHQRFDEIKKRDEEKNKVLKESGWNILRLDWKWVFHNTQEAIQLSKDFIDKANFSYQKLYEVKIKEVKIKEVKIRKNQTDSTLLEIRKKSLKDFDLLKFGWVKKVAKVWGISSQKVGSYFRRYFNDVPRFERKKHSQVVK